MSPHLKEEEEGLKTAGAQTGCVCSRSYKEKRLTRPKG